jgi:hypothetical protein
MGACQCAWRDTGWTGGERVDFFVSHAGADRAWAEWVAWQLADAGYSVELDVWDWAAGQNFVTAISLEITDSAGQPVQADTHLSQRVGGEASIREVTTGNLIDEAATWGIRRRAAAAVVTEMLEQVLTAIPQTPGDERVLAAIREQATRVRDR